MPSNILVSGAGRTATNGLYTYRGSNEPSYSNKPYWIKQGFSNLEAGFTIFYIDLEGSWFIGIDPYYSASDPSGNANPWSLTWQVETAAGPAPALTESLSSGSGDPFIPPPTIAIPVRLPAIVIEKFGSESNYLRLRLLGII